jgi:hypothetical protein
LTLNSVLSWPGPSLRSAWCPPTPFVRELCREHEALVCGRGGQYAAVQVAGSALPIELFLVGAGEIPHFSSELSDPRSLDRGVRCLRPVHPQQAVAPNTGLMPTRQDPRQGKTAKERRQKKTGQLPGGCPVSLPNTALKRLLLTAGPRCFPAAASDRRSRRAVDRCPGSGGAGRDEGSDLEGIVTIIEVA